MKKLDQIPPANPRFGVLPSTGNIISGEIRPTPETLKQIVAAAKAQVKARLEKSASGLRKEHGYTRTGRRHFWKMIKALESGIRRVEDGRESGLGLDIITTFASFTGYYLPTTQDTEWVDP